MKTLLVTLIGLMMVASSAEAKGRKAKPVVCESYSIIADKNADDLPIAVCYDQHVDGGLTLRYFAETTVYGANGPTKVVVGYR